MSYSLSLYTECTALEEKLKEVLVGVCSLCGLSASGGDCSCQADPTWTSISIRSFGISNLRSTGTISFVIPSSIPVTAKEVLVFTEIQNGSSGPQDRISRLKLYTEEGNKRYEQYITIHTYIQGAWNTNSDNMWFPLMSNRRLYLEKPNVHSGGVSVQVFAIGYR